MTNMYWDIASSKTPEGLRYGWSRLSRNKEIDFNRAVVSRNGSGVDSDQEEKDGSGIIDWSKVADWEKFT